MRDRGEITALDLYDNRLALLRRQAELEGVHIIHTVCANAASFESDKRYDRVLCDVPCSGYGEIAAKPELRQKPPMETNPLFDLQRSILEKGASLLKPGGRLVYSTCTIDKRENEQVLHAFLHDHPEFCAVPVKVEGAPAPQEEGFLRILPDQNGPEGFFMAAIEYRK